MAGKVVVDDAVISTPGTQVRTTARIHIRDMPLRYASRGGFKLEHALRTFQIDTNGLVCLDAGASTGGFTDCLLQHGARRVYAVDVGYGQLRGRLANDPRVVSMERTNISDIRRADLDPPIDFACVDFSYLSLRKAVPIVLALFEKPVRAVFLVKPLYEGLRQEDMASHPALSQVVADLLRDLHELHFDATNVCVSPVFGGRGAIEFLLEFGGPTMLDAQTAAQRAQDDLVQNPPRELPADSGGDAA